MSCLVTAVFPLLLVDKKESLLTMYVLSSVCNLLMTFISLCSVAGGVTILSTGLLGAYHAAGGMIGKPRLRRSFLILTITQVSRDRFMISWEVKCRRVDNGLKDSFYCYRNHHHRVFCQ